MWRFGKTERRSSFAYATNDPSEFMKILLEPNFTILNALIESLDISDESQSSDPVAKILVDLLVSRKRIIPMLNNLITREVRIIDQPNTLFRRNSICSKMLSKYTRENGLPMLRFLLSDVLQQLNSMQPGLHEVDPQKLQGEYDLNANRDRLRVVLEEFIVQVLNSVDQCPVEFRRLCHHLRAEVVKRFPSMGRSAVGGYFFLRFVCPAIVAPQSFGLCGELKPHARRILLYISKVIQNLSNGVLVFKELHLTFLDDFLESNVHLINSFLDDISSVPSMPTHVIAPSVAKQDEEEALLAIHHHLKYNIHKIGSVIAAQSQGAHPAALIKAEKRGWLRKQGGSVKSWKRRWFVLKERELYYFKGPQVPNAAGRIPLTAACSLENVPGGIQFLIRTGYRTFLCEAETESECYDWVRAVNQCIDALQKEKPSADGTPSSSSASTTTAGAGKGGNAAHKRSDSGSTLQLGSSRFSPDRRADSGSGCHSPRTVAIGLRQPRLLSASTGFPSDTSDASAGSASSSRTRATTTLSPRESASMPDASKLRGWLRKAGPNGKNFKKRYFVLNNDSFLYFKHDTDATPAGEIPLIGSRLVDVYSKKNCFDIVSETGRTYYLQAGDDAEKIFWIKTLKQAKVAAMKEGTRHSHSSLQPHTDVHLIESQAVDKEGYLFKQGGNFRTWRHRWFVLKGNCMYYYKTPHDSRPLGAIPLGNASILRPEEASTSFQILTNARNYFLRAKNTLDLSSWLTAVKDSKRRADAGAESSVVGASDDRVQGEPMDPTDTDTTTLGAVSDGDGSSSGGGDSSAGGSGGGVGSGGSGGDGAEGSNGRGNRGSFSSSLANGATDNTDESSLELKGWLMKQGARMKSWRRRWFILRPGLLAYYKSPGDVNAVGVIPLQNCTCALAGDKLEKKFAFEVFTRYRNYFLVAKDEYEMAHWMQRIEQAKVVSSEGESPGMTMFFRLNQVLADWERKVAANGDGRISE